MLYLFIILIVLFKLFNLITLFYCIKSGIRRKWLWFFIILILNIIRVSLNLGSEQVSVELFNLSLLGFAYIKYAHMSSWILSFNLPIGAIIWSCSRLGMP